jgi:hypothetical protein
MKKTEPDFKDEYLETAESAINQLIDQLNIQNFTNVHDITIENLKDFLIPVLKNYEKEQFYWNTLKDISEWLNTYLLNYYRDSEGYDLIYAETNPWFPGLYVLDMMDGHVDTINGPLSYFLMAQEDAPVTIEFLKAPLDKQADAYQKMWIYVSSIKWIDRSVPVGDGYTIMDSLCGKDKIHIDIRRCMKTTH